MEYSKPNNNMKIFNGLPRVWQEKRIKIAKEKP